MRYWILAISWTRYSNGIHTYSNLFVAADDPIKKFLELRRQHKHQEWDVLLNYWEIDETTYLEFIKD